MARRSIASVVSCALLASLASVAVAAEPAAAPPPEKLAWEDLVDHPERWPETVKLTRMIRFSPTDAVDAGTECRVVGVSAGHALLQADNTQFEAPPDFCGLLEASNAAWAKLTPEQRAVTLDAVVADKSLWPAAVTVKEAQNFGAFEIKAGETVPMLFVTPQRELALAGAGQAQWAPVPIAMTDFLARAREIAATPPEKRVGRMAGLLEGKLVDTDGKPAAVKPAEHYIIYWSGSRCEWCAQYNAKWVAYYNKALADRKDVQVLGIGNDRQMPAYYAYAKKNQYAWPILPSEHMLLTSALEDLGTVQMPGIIVLDKHGAIEASTLRQRGSPLQTADGVVAEIDKLLAAESP